MKELTIDVEGIECSGCENRSQNAVETIDGVKSVVASHEKGTVTIVADENVSENEIKNTIQDIGFEVKA